MNRNEGIEREMKKIEAARRKEFDEAQEQADTEFDLGDDSRKLLCVVGIVVSILIVGAAVGWYFYGGSQ